MEEIEKAANEIINDGTTLGYFDTFAKYEKTGFIKGPKWQEKRMYSEEEVKRFIFDALRNFDLRNGRIELEQWFNEFKK